MTLQKVVADAIKIAELPSKTEVTPKSFDEVTKTEAKTIIENKDKSLWDIRIMLKRAGKNISQEQIKEVIAEYKLQTSPKEEPTEEILEEIIK